MTILSFDELQAGDVILVHEESTLNGVVEATGRVLNRETILGTECWAANNFIVLPEPKNGVNRTITLISRLAPPPEKLSIISVVWEASWKNRPENVTLHYTNGEWVGRLGAFKTSELVPLITEWSLLLS